MMMTSLTLLTPPATEPVTLVEAKQHLRMDTTSDDALITNLIVAARLLAELWTGRSLITQTWLMRLDAAPVSNFVRLPKAPLQSVSFIKTYDDADVASVFAASNYFVDTASAPSRVILRLGASWPSVARTANGFELQFVAGYGPNGSDVPAPIRQGLLMHIARLYAQRGDLVGPDGHARGELPDTLPEECLALYRPYRVMRGLS